MAEKDKIDLKMFLKDYRNDASDGFQEAFNALLVLEKDFNQTEKLDDIFRPIHTLKSSSNMLEFFDIAEAAHTVEDMLDCMKKGDVIVNKETIDILFNAVEAIEDMVRERAEGKKSKIDFQPYALKIKELMRNVETEKEDVQPDKRFLPRLSIEKVETVRVHVNLLDSLFNMVGELIITKNRIENIIADSERKDLKAALTDMNRIINVLQENISTARLVPADEIFQKFPRMARDLAKEQSKEIDFIVEGREIEIDKSLIDALTEPLIHLIRNAVDHGIEPAEARRNSGKKSIGTVRLTAQRTENHILIDVVDDGAGIDIEKIREIAVKKGFAKQEEAAVLKERDVLNMLFMPGFTSKENATDISGRGVGLNVVLTSAKKMGGTVEIMTEKGKGTRFLLKLPLTTSLIHTLMIGVGDNIFAVPTDIVLETIEADQSNIKEVGNSNVLILRGEAIPFLRLDEILRLNGRVQRQVQQSHPVLIIHKGEKFFAVGVDVVLDQMENIIKPFDPIAQQFKGFSGGIILGNGRVALLLDILSLLELEAMKEEKYEK